MHRILYVEDHDDTRDLLTLVLESRNYEVTSAQTIATALTLVRQQKFDLFLLDSWLPDGSGIDLCKGIRHLDIHTPIIFYSAAAFESDKTMALGAGAQGYLIKPARLSELCDLISSLIEDSQTKKSRTRPIEQLPHVRFSQDTES